jgi:inosine-uridine nucleoside N-ribohydrolase
MDHCSDGLSNITERHPELSVPLEEQNATSHPQLQIADQSATAVILDLIKSRPSRTITYLALGPLTTLAHAMLSDGELIRDRIGNIFCLGGALDVPGNTTPVAECEIHSFEIDSCG